MAAYPQSSPTTPHAQPLPGITHAWFSLIHVRSPLLAESQLFSSPTGTEMFHFPASTPTQTMHSSAGNTTQPVLGFPIRTSSDQRFVGNSPRHNAASHVLHRLSMPRHPPYALVTKQKHTTNKQQTTTTHKQHDNHLLLGKLTIKKFFHKNKDARVHYTVLTQHTPHTNHQPNKSVINTWNQSRQHNCCLRHPTVHQHTIINTPF